MTDLLTNGDIGDVMSDSDSDDGGGLGLGGILWGNIGEGHELEVDYLDKVRLCRTSWSSFAHLTVVGLQWLAAVVTWL